MSKSPSKDHEIVMELLHKVLDEYVVTCHSTAGSVTDDLTNDIGFCCVQWIGLLICWYLSCPI
jgi:hypothetical protein